MLTFRVALTGDFLNETGTVAYRDIRLDLLQNAPFIAYHFLRDQAPGKDDPEYWNRFYSLEVTPEHIAGVNGLIVLRPWIKRSTFGRGAGDLVVIGRSGAGYDKIDLAACTENDVAVFNVPGALTHSTASTALLFMLALAKRLPEQEQVARTGRWDRQAQVMGIELRGRTLGIIGLGRIGREVVRLVEPFDMDVISYSPHADPAQAEILGVGLTSLDALLRASDFVTITARLTEKKRKMIGVSQLALMKRSAYLVNVSRGEIVDQPALVEALRERRIAGAGLDVFEEEPLPADDPLTDLDNVILTPHFAPATADVWKATGKATANGMLKVAQGNVPPNVINEDVLERPGFQAKLARFSENNREG